MRGLRSVTARSPADRSSPPSSRRRRVRDFSRLSRSRARRRDSSMSASTASRDARGIRLSTAISCATNWAIFARFSSVSGIAVSTRTSYPDPVIRDRRREDVRKVLDIARADEDEVARHVVHADTRSRALRVPSADREALLLHRGEDVPLKMSELRELVNEQDALVRLAA